MARRQRCLAFVVSGGRPSVRGEGRGKRDLSENVGSECFLTWEERESRHTRAFSKLKKIHVNGVWSFFFFFGKTTKTNKQTKRRVVYANNPKRIGKGRRKGNTAKIRFGCVLTCHINGVWRYSKKKGKNKNRNVFLKNLYIYYGQIEKKKKYIYIYI